MDKYIKANIMFSAIWTSILIMYLMEVKVEMTWQTILVAAVPAVITFIATLYVSRKSQIKKNTEAFEKLTRQLGLNDNISLFKKTSDEHSDILKVIGNNQDGDVMSKIGVTLATKSLTEQHNDILKNIDKSFSVIQNRYESEDDKYNKFTDSQYNLNEIMTNFVRDYSESVSREHLLKIKTKELSRQIKYLENEKKELINELEEYRQDQTLDLTPNINPSLHI